MGAEFLLTYINKIEEDVEPDFDAIRNAVNMRDEFVDSDECSYEKEEILNCVQSLEAAWNGKLRDASKIKVYGKETLFSGGMSHGDVPTQTYQDISTLLYFPEILEVGNLT